MARIITIANQKGGVGKTTTCVNLAASLAAAKRRTLMVDIDPQGNATMGSGINKQELGLMLNELMLGKAQFQNVCISSSAGYDVLPSNSNLTEAEVKLLQKEHREVQLRQILEPIKQNYDFIVIDCPPSLNILTLNALVAADSILIPMQCEYYALEGLAGLLDTVERLKSAVNSGLEIEGILRTMYDGRNRLSIEVSEQLLTHFGSKVFRTVIPRNVRLAEAPSYGMPGLIYDKSSHGAIAYLALAGEILRRQQKEGGA